VGQRRTSSKEQHAPERDLLAEIEQLGGQLREVLIPILEKVAGPRPRPTALTRSLGLDKSLASLLVRAANAPNDLELMHLVPAPAGLRILADSAARGVGPAAIKRLQSAARSFQELIDSTPGGRAALDALISESSDVARARREQIARQSSFKSMSYLIGYFSDVLSTTFFVVPSGNGRSVDGIEISRRFGLRRLRPGTPVPILSYAPWPAGGAGGEATRLDSIEGAKGSPEPRDLLMPEFSTRPMPRIEAVRDPGRTTFVLPGDLGVQEVERLAWAFRYRNGGPLELGPGYHPLGDYLLHMPCRRLIRDLFIDESLYAGAVPRLMFVLPDSEAHRRPPNELGVRRYGDIHVTATLEPLPRSDRAYSLSGVADHAAITRSVLERAGHGSTRFRGWRCEMTYPVPLVQMSWWLSLPIAKSVR
jgi:hypothetical protein